MQISEFMNGGIVAHKVYLDGYKSKFSVWVSPLGIITDAARYDSCNREFPVKRDSMAWMQLDGRAQIIFANHNRAKGKTQ